MKRPFASLLAALSATAAWASEDNAERLARGAYLAQIMDCAGCHMPRDQNGVPIHEAGLSGGTIGFEIPGLGTFWPSNLTPAASALGGWSAEEIDRAIRVGIRPDDRTLAPVMPYMNCAAMTDEDASDLVVYLQSLDPVDSPVPDPVSPGEPAPAPFYRFTLPTQPN